MERRSRSRSPDVQNDKAAGSRTIKSVCFRPLYPAGFSYTVQVLFPLIHVLDQAICVFRLMGYEFDGICNLTISYVWIITTFFPGYMVKRFRNCRLAGHFYV